MVAERSYAAFISYSHADEKLASWLHRKLEAYRTPGPLVGRATARGKIGKRVGKVFRDRAELGADHDLGGEIRAALERSDALIVLCSPRAAQSRYVNEEIRYFKSLGRGERIMAAIAGGEPHAAGKTLGHRVLSDADECFPQALLRQLGSDGAISEAPEPLEPIAADFRSGKDEHEGGKLKLIAGLLSVGLDDLIQRERIAQRWRMRAVAALAAVFAALGIAAAGFAVLAERNAAEARLQAGRVTERLAAQQIRAGDIGQGVDLLRSIAGRPQVVSLDRVHAFAAGLTPLGDVVGQLPAGAPFKWNGRAYVRGADQLYDLGQFAPMDWAGDGRFVALMSGEYAIVVFDTQTGVVTARETADGSFFPCAMETNSSGGFDIFGITQAGATMGGTSYSRWRINGAGAAVFEIGDRDLPFGRAPRCQFGDVSESIRPVPTLAFPIARAEAALWRGEQGRRTTTDWLEQTFSQTTGLNSSALQLVFARGLERGPDWYGVHGFAQGDGAFAMGSEEYGMAGESWGFCATSGREGACKTFSYPLMAGVLDGVSVSSDGRAAAAFGLGIRMLDYTPDWAARQQAWRNDENAPYPEPVETEGNLFIASGGRFSRWTAPETLNALGRIRDVAFSPSSDTLAIVTSDGLYTSSVGGAELARSPFAIDAGELRGVAWRDDGVLILALSDLSLAAVGRDGALAWDRLALVDRFAPCDNPEEIDPQAYENTIWLAADSQASLVVLGRGDCAVVVDAALGAPITGLVRLGDGAERAPLLFDRPRISAHDSTLQMDFYWSTFTRTGLAERQNLSALTGRIDGALASSLTALERPSR
ncbi:MAG: TIR domain-containing protein [Hyphomonadaceae bacterium]